MDFTHLDDRGEAKMVDISSKKVQYRLAQASGKVFMGEKTLGMIKDDQIKKGDVLSVARIAAISGAKKTFELIPLCHNISINTIDISFKVEDDGIRIVSKAICEAKTGIEMEALTAVAIAALTIYDMCKAVDRKMIISDIKLDKKIKK